VQDGVIKWGILRLYFNRRKKLLIKNKNMFLEIATILIILWILGFSLHVLGGLIHVFLVLALILIVWHFLTGKKI